KLWRTSPHDDCTGRKNNGHWGFRTLPFEESFHFNVSYVPVRVVLSDRQCLSVLFERSCVRYRSHNNECRSGNPSLKFFILHFGSYVCDLLTKFCALRSGREMRHFSHGGIFAVQPSVREENCLFFQLHGPSFH